MHQRLPLYQINRSRGAKHLSSDLCHPWGHWDFSSRPEAGRDSRRSQETHRGSVVPESHCLGISGGHTAPVPCGQGDTAGAPDQAAGREAPRPAASSTLSHPPMRSLQHFLTRVGLCGPSVRSFLTNRRLKERWAEVFLELLALPTPHRRLGLCIPGEREGRQEGGPPVGHLHPSPRCRALGDGDGLLGGHVCL